MASTVLTRTPSGAGNRKTFTWSFWFKRTTIAVESALFSHGANAGSDMCMLRFDPDVLNLHNGASNAAFSTNRKLRDVNGWFHVVLRMDTTQATNTDRMKLYINGVQETSFSSITYPNQNEDTDCNTTSTLYIGERPDDNKHFDGIMSHVHFCDGYSYGADSFGETDATTGEWKIKTSPSVSYGTNGFCILKDGNSVTDQSPNSNNFAVGGGTLTNTEDNPSNVFCTLNPLGMEKWTLSNGNLSISGASDNQMMIGTMHSDAGYYEVKLAGSGHGSGGKGARIGLCKADGSNALTYSGISGTSGDLERFIGVQNTAGNYKAIYNNGNDVTNYSSDSWSQNDILQVAWKNNKIWYGVNGTWLGSGNPSGGTNEADTLTSGSMYLPAIISSLAGADDCHFNFGNGYFGTTAISSEGTNASGIGKFEYDVPTGCTAVSTKGLNE